MATKGMALMRYVEPAMIIKYIKNDFVVMNYLLFEQKTKRASGYQLSSFSEADSSPETGKNTAPIIADTMAHILTEIPAETLFSTGM